ncbi:unnamed protein product [Adineta steineri]|uniref:Apple domain-containing protein n=1 Tax=Adineta steineri TaxID=433720 RepID=A0A813Z2W8_9BILA|nr:unnamed protein product [Adineta steineri]CAF1384569.1 unnamed protein product [Adineta steineri]
MLFIIYFVLFSSNILIATSNNTQNIIKFDEDTLKKLKIPSNQLSSFISYQDYELFNEFQCAIECIKDKDNCNAYSYDGTTNQCSLYHDSNKIIDDNVTKLREQLKTNVCDKVKCKPDAVCIGETEAKCICLNGAETPDNCDQIETGVWSDFKDWSVCSSTCGEGYQFRKRDCLSENDRNKKISNEHCIGKDTETQLCVIKACPTYGPWTTWTPCSTFCGIGMKQRNRSCVPPGSTCGNYTYEQRACGEANCQRVVGIKETEPKKFPMKGYLAIREGDILCIPQSNNETAKHMADLVCKSVGSTRGAQYAILTPIGANSTCYPGILCDGTETSFHDCKYQRSQTTITTSDLFAIITRCIVDGGFSSWSDWSTCTKSCGNGESTRSRTCTQPSPSILEPELNSINSSLNGMNCTGDYTQVKTCNKQKC